MSFPGHSRRGVANHTRGRVCSPSATTGCRVFISFSTEGNQGNTGWDHLHGFVIFVCFCEFSVTQRGWMLDVLNIVRRLSEAGTARCAVSAPSGRKFPAALPAGTSQRDVPTNTFTTADAYAFTRELEQLHPYNRHVRDNPVNNTGQEFASTSKSYATLDCYCTSSAASGVCHDFFRQNDRSAELNSLNSVCRHPTWRWRTFSINRLTRLAMPSIQPTG